MEPDIVPYYSVVNELLKHMDRLHECQLQYGPGSGVSLWWRAPYMLKAAHLVILLSDQEHPQWHAVQRCSVMFFPLCLHPLLKGSHLPHPQICIHAGQNLHPTLASCLIIVLDKDRQCAAGHYSRFMHNVKEKSVVKFCHSFLTIAVSLLCDSLLLSQCVL